MARFIVKNISNGRTEDVTISDRTIEALAKIREAADPSKIAYFQKEDIADEVTRFLAKLSHKK